MALNYGKLNFSTSFNPTFAFPLDARSYFESYNEAVLAAASAVEVGSSDSTYYFGQTLVVVENNSASFYIIQPNGTLSAITGSNGETSIAVNPNLFVFDQAGNLSLVGFDEAEAGAFFFKNLDGTLSWTKPIDAYTKTETDEKIAAAIAAADHLKRKVVANLKEAQDYALTNSDADQYIFMVPTGLTEDDDKYDEYVVIFVADIPTLEKVGSWEVDLTDYVKQDDIKEALNGKVDKVDGYGLISNSDLERILAMKPSVIEAVDETTFSITDKILFLKDLPVSKVSGLQTILNSKVDAKPGYGLISEADQNKLNAITLNNDGSLEISGGIEVSNITNLADWINDHASDTVGLSENNLTNELFTKLSSMLYIKSVDPKELDVTNDGYLSIIAIDASKVTGLQDALNTKASQDDYLKTVEKVQTLSDMMLQHSEKIESHDKDIQGLWEAVTWQDIIV